MANFNISVLGSGSKGNCTLIETPNTKILIDCGFSAKETTRRLDEIGVNPNDVNAIFLTHEHKDHTLGIENFASKFNIPVFGHSLTLSEYERGLKKYVELNEIITEDFYFRELTVSPFNVSHDSKHCNGYSIYCQGEKFSLTTDLGYIDENILSAMRGSQSIVIESNHDPKMLKENWKYPQVLKDRIAGKCGHLSNQDCANAIVDLAKNGTNSFILAHLSHENNSAMTAKDTTMNSLLSAGADAVNEFNIQVASQDLVVKMK